MKIATTSARVACEVCYLTYIPPVSAPVAITNPAANISILTATLNGTVQGSYATTTVTFEYGTTASYGNSVNATPSTVTGNASISVNANLTGLTNGTLYHFRVKAVNSAGTTYGNDLTFTTVAITAPVVTTLAASGITTTGAVLNGTVNASNATATVTFEYGLTTSYGSTINAIPNTVTGNSTTAVSATIAGLTANTLYHFRAKAINSVGTTYGADLPFTTLAPPCTDSYEVNNTQATAKGIATGTNINALINVNTDVDWFKFNNSTTAKNIQVELFNLPADYDVQFYNSAGTLLATSQNRGTTRELLKYNTSTLGTYSIKIYPYNGAFNATICYTALVSINKVAYKSLETSDETTVTADDFESLSIFPNPSSGKINLDYTAAADGKIDVKILNLTGTSVMETIFSAVDGSNSFSMDLTGQPDGIYILELTSEHDRILKKVMVRK